MSSSVPHDWIGQTLVDRYHVTEKIGAGGMGTVFKASDTRLGAEVVVKAPHPVMIKDAEFAARFKREIQSLVKLSHPNIVNVMDVGEHDGLPFAVMQYLSGGSLEDRPRPCPPEEVSAWLPDVADALDFMHSEGLVHRDIKPGNILFNASGRAYLGDFGISKVVFESDGAELSGLTGTGTLIGTAEYMPPEILLPSRYGETSDGRSDQYALAVTVYEMLSGHPPFQGDTMTEVVALLVTEEAVPLDELATGIPESLSDVVGKALQKQPEDRYSSCEAFASSFTAAVEGGAGGSVTKTPPQRPSPGKVAADGRQATQVEAAGPSRTPTVLEPSSTPPRRGTMPEKFDPADLPGTQLDRGETVQERRPSTRTERFRRVVDDLPPQRVISAVAIFLFAVVVLGIVFSGGPKEPEGIDPDGPDPNNMGPSTGAPAYREPNGTSLPEVTNSIGMKLRLIPAGKFMMGSPGTESFRSDNETQHRVTITKPFYLGETEVTQEQYQKVMGKNPSQFKRPQNPVEQVSWADAVEFCRKLSAMPAEKTAGHVYRLPTEAEWEYACRAGTMTSYGFDGDASRLGAYGWFDENSDSKTHPVGEKKPNAWGLYDMHGNVYEWCRDQHRIYLSDSATDPTGATSGSYPYRVVRGGSWINLARDCRSALRHRYSTGDRNSILGFRVLRSSIGSAAGGGRKPVKPSGSVGPPEATGAATKPTGAKKVKNAVTNSIGIKLRLIPAGEFVMGSPETESHRLDDETQHRVTITKPFYLGETEVTQEQYQKVMGTNPSEFKGSQNPVEQVSWADAVEFCRKLSAMPDEKTAGHVYRLPTEAEWEYACRGGTTTAYGFGDDASRFGDYGWFEGNSDSKTHPVGEKKPNAWGLYDMHGNVREWCQDRYGNYPIGSATDPTRAPSGSDRVFRGGGWSHYARRCRSAYRYRGTRVFRLFNLGFRVVRSSIK